MMGKGADGGYMVTGCGDAACNTSFGSLSKCHAQCKGLGKAAGRDEQLRRGIDCYTQVLKALALKPVHAGEDLTGANGFLNASNENKRKNKVKKSDFTDCVSQHESNWTRDAWGHQFWVFMEEFFRELNPEDIQVLMPITKIPGSSADNSFDPLFMISPVGCFYKDVEKEAGMGQQVETGKTPSVTEALVDKIAESTISSKRKRLSTSNFDNKKRKLTAPMPKTLVTIISPVNNDSRELCDVCYGDDRSEDNQILFCDLCNVAVHQDCYGVKIVPYGQWLCSWCSHNAQGSRDGAEVQNQPAECVLCSRKGGAVKQVACSRIAGRNAFKTSFGHLFCCQWIPETFIGDVQKMEPIMNVEGIRQERWKLVCSICREKCGACIQCSHGLCATAFHPLCARQARLRMEVSSTEESDQIDLNAFCLKHSLQLCKSSSSLNAGIEDAHDLINTKATSFAAVAGNLNKAAENSDVVSSQCSYLDVSVLSDMERRVIRNAMESLHIGIADVATKMSVSCDGLCTWLEGEDLHDREMEAKIKSWVAKVTEEEVAKTLGSNNIPKFSQNKRQKTEEPSPLIFQTDVHDVERAKGQYPVERQCVVKRQENSSCSVLRVRGTGGVGGHNFHEGPPSFSGVMDSKLGLNGMSQIYSESPDSLNGWQPFASNCSRSVKLSESMTVCEKVDSSVSASSYVDVNPFVMERLEKIHLNRIEKKRAGEARPVMTPKYFIDDIHQRAMESQLRQLEYARELGIFNMSARDEIEEEILGLQLRLIACVEKNLEQCEGLIVEVIKNLGDDLHASRRRVADMELVNDYLATVREAKKLGRKERRNKEAQAVLAAAAAVAAASSRAGTFRKDTMASHRSDERHNVTSGSSPATQENMQLCGVGTTAPPDTPKPMKLGIGPNRTSFASQLHDKAGLSVHVEEELLTTSTNSPGESRPDPAMCDICKTLSLMNTTIVCACCKITVHQECYGVSGVSTSDWFCQPCSEIVSQLQGSRHLAASDLGIPGCGVTCALCFGLSGAFKRYCERDWAHVFCAQWVPEAVYRKEDTSFIDGLKLVPPEKFSQECGICHRSEGVRLRCSFGHCHGAFHPICARDAELFMNMKCSPNGCIHYRAYCERHSPQQRQKAESRKCGTTDEMAALMQMRAELERVRIICERISKRERLKRDMMMCIRSLFAAHMSPLSSAIASNTASNSQDAPVAFYKDLCVTNHQRYGPLPLGIQWMESESHSCQDTLSGESVHQTQLSCSDPFRRSQTSNVIAIRGEWSNGWADQNLKLDEQRRLKQQQKAAPPHEAIVTSTEASVQNR